MRIGPHEIKATRWAIGIVTKKPYEVTKLRFLQLLGGRVRYASWHMAGDVSWSG